MAPQLWRAHVCSRPGRAESMGHSKCTASERIVLAMNSATTIFSGERGRQLMLSCYAHQARVLTVTRNVLSAAGTAITGSCDCDHNYFNYVICNNQKNVHLSTYNFGAVRRHESGIQKKKSHSSTLRNTHSFFIINHVGIEDLQFFLTKI